MAFCTNCGAEVQGKFCAKCGAPAPGEPAASSAASPPPASGPLPPPAPPPSLAAPGLEENLACALCYVLGLLTGVLFLVLEPYNRNRLIRFHAFQSIFLWLASLVCWIAVLIV